MNMILKKILIVIVILIGLCINSYGQGGSIIFDSKGNDFWLAFLPNYHNNNLSPYPELKNGDSLYIFIVAEVQTTGNINYTDRYGNNFNQPFVINDPKKIYTFKVNHIDFEVSGYNKGGTMIDNNDPENQSEKVGVNSFHVTSDNDITVYAHSQAVTTSDAFLVLPTDVLGTEHLVLSYSSDGQGSNGMGPWTEISGSTPSQFLIVASEDSTVIDIYHPYEQFHRSRSNKIHKVLNTGEVFLVQARISQFNLNADLTGTEVISNKPVAVFAGEQRATVPLFFDLGSRDVLLEQILPVNTWGKNAYVIPYVNPPGSSTLGGDRFRVLFAENNTDFYINGNYEGRKDRGEFIEQVITGPMSIEATGPILVAEYKQTSQDNGNGNIQPISDPFMMIVPPKEQFMYDYSVINNQTWENEASKGYPQTPTGNIIPVYDRHYISVVAPDDAIANTKIDNKLIMINQFMPIPGSNYYYANVQVSPGAHTVNSSGRIGVYVYGFGYANSYGYVGGLSLMSFDFKRPELLAVDSCYQLRGMVFDSSRNDTKLKSVILDNNSLVNVNVNVEQFKPYRDSVAFNADLKDIYKDGSFSITATDSVNLDSTQIFNIAGFTVSVDSTGSSDKPIYFKNSYRALKEFCESFDLFNYGKFSHQITNIYWKNNRTIDINLQAPFNIESSEHIPLEICFSFDRDTVIKDTLIISEDCGIRKVLAVDLTFKIDDIVPKASVITDPCKTNVQIQFTDSTTFDWGLKSVDVIDTVNCNIVSFKRSPVLTSYSIEIIDPFKDAIYSVKATDSLNNSVTVSDTIQGFTIVLPQFSDTTSVMNYNSEKISSIKCDTLKLMNTGILPFVIDNIFLKKNVTFSIPQIQFPMVIQPGDEENLSICFHPVNTKDLFKDTLILFHNCLSIDVELIGEGDSLIYYADTDCNVRIKAESHSIDPKYYLEHNYPNPVLNITKFSFYLNESSNVNLEVFDILGNKRQIVTNTVFPKGYQDIEANLSDLSSGVYYYVLKTNETSIRGTLVKE